MGSGSTPELPDPLAAHSQRVRLEDLMLTLLPALSHLPGRDDLQKQLCPVGNQVAVGTERSSGPTLPTPCHSPYNCQARSMNSSLQLQRLMGTSHLSPGPLPLSLLAVSSLSNSDNLAQLLDSSANEIRVWLMPLQRSCSQIN